MLLRKETHKKAVQNQYTTPPVNTHTLQRVMLVSPFTSTMVVQALGVEDTHKLLRQKKYNMALRNCEKMFPIKDGAGALKV